MPSSEDPNGSVSTPYAGLTPSLVLDALDAVGLRGDGRLIQLNSYENRVFQVFLEDGRVVEVAVKVAEGSTILRWTTSLRPQE